MTFPRLRPAGDAGLLLEYEERIDPEVNARVIAAAAALRAAAVPGVRDIVPTYRSVAVHFDPLATEVGRLRDRVAEAGGRGTATVDGRRLEIPVAYGGEAGPDLPDVAAGAGLTPEAVIARHAGTPFRVYMLGFLPGFPYMGLLDPVLAVPRRTRPRARVPAGSVGLAGRQTGIYPQVSPGGWQIIGRTAMRIFDPAGQPAALLAPGDEVCFVPSGMRDVVDVPEPAAAGGHLRDAAAAARAVTVLRPGLLTSVQDEGRWGHQGSGMPVAGALDAVSHRMANALVGNDRNAAGLEVTLVGPELRFEAPATFAVAGADLEATLDGTPVPLEMAVACRGGSVLRFGTRRAGARAYVAFDGGIAVEPVLGSRATHVLSRIGGIAGRPVAAGDRLPLGPPRAAPPTRRRPPARVTRDRVRLRVLPGPQAEAFFGADALDQLQQVRLSVGIQSNRMGFHLAGAPLARVPAREMISDATFSGGLQVPPSGEPILLLADRQTTGGYPQLAIVITADLPRAAQLAPGDPVRFEVCTAADAVRALVAQEGPLLALG